MKNSKKCTKKKITLSDIILMDRKIRREIEIEMGMNSPSHRIHRSKKTYTRKSKHRHEKTF